MSVISMLKGISEGDKQFQELVKNELPKKEDFKTISGVPAFSKYEEKAPYNLNTSYEASLVGTAFDYLARFIVALKLKNDNKGSVINLKAALYGLRACEHVIDEKSYNKLLQKYRESLTTILIYIFSDNSYIPKSLMQYLSQESVQAYHNFLTYELKKSNIPGYKEHISKIECLIPSACFLAKLEQIYRSGYLPENGIDDILAIPNEIIKKDLCNLCNIFEETFINSEIVKENSFVVFNPSFGIASFLVMGADADIYIDGVLYDFKSSKITGYKWQDIAQLKIYFILDIITKLKEDYDIPSIPSELREYRIDRIAFYKARFGEIEYLDTEYFEKEKAKHQNVQDIIDFLGK